MRPCHKCGSPSTNERGTPVCDGCRVFPRPNKTQTCAECGDTFQLQYTRHLCHRCYYQEHGKTIRCEGCGASVDRRAKSGLCRTCWGAEHSGEDSSNWQGGRTFHKPSGYWLVKRPDHPNARGDGYVREHVLVASESIGRPIYQHEVVHHLNHDKTDNRPENLQVMSRTAHSLLHSGKVTFEDVAHIRQVAAENGYPPGQQGRGGSGWAVRLAKQYGIGKVHVYRIARGDARRQE